MSLIMSTAPQIYASSHALTIVETSTGFLPKMSEDAPISGEAKNWRKENNDPNRPAQGRNI